MKDISNIIKEYENLTYKGYVQKRPKYEPIDSYFYLERQLAKYMMRADTFNFHVKPVRVEITGQQQITISHVCDSDNIKSKSITADKRLSQVCSTDESET